MPKDEKRCPNCGACKECGAPKGGYQPWPYPWTTNPWGGYRPTLPSPWHYPHVTYSGSVTNVTSTVPATELN